MSTKDEARMREPRPREAQSFDEAFWRFLRRGMPREEAFHRASEWERRRKKPSN